MAPQSWIVAAALVIAALVYVGYSHRSGSWVNVLTPTMFVAIPSLYLAELVRIQQTGPQYPPLIYAYTYACYVLPLLAYVAFLSRIEVPVFLRIAPKPVARVGAMPYAFLAAGLLLYSPIAIQYWDDLLTNPRLVYEQTRTGFGINFFLSSMLAMVAFILFLFRERRGRLETAAFFATCSVFALAHGSKGQVITFALIWMLHRRYVEGRKVSFLPFLATVGMLAGALVGLFVFFSVGVEAVDIVNLVAGYSDFTSNGMMVIAADEPARWGSILVEDNLFSRIPRVLYENKPKDFGSNILAKIYYPEVFDLDAGNPAFGVGITFADFKWFALPILTLFGAASGLLTKSFLDAVRCSRHPADFLMFLFFAGVPVLYLGVGYLLPEHLFLAAFIGLVLRLRWIRPATHELAADCRR